MIWGLCSEWAIPSKCDPILKQTIARMIRRPFSSYFIYRLAPYVSSTEGAKVGIIFVCVEVVLGCVEWFWGWDGSLILRTEEEWEDLVVVIREKEFAIESGHGQLLQRGGGYAYGGIPTTDYDGYDEV